MAVTSDIVATWRRPRQVMRRHLAAGVREDRAFVFLMLACGLIFVAQWPRLAREAHLSEEVPLDALLGGSLMGWLFIAPLALYFIGAVTHIVAHLMGGRGTWYSARLALFWALLAASPLWLLNGLVAGFVGPGPELKLTGFVGLAAFVTIWLLCLFEAERPGNLEPRQGAE